MQNRKRLSSSQLWLLVILLIGQLLLVVSPAPAALGETPSARIKLFGSSKLAANQQWPSPLSEGNDSWDVMAGDSHTPTSDAHLSEIPIQIHRRAAQHLEEVRGTDMAPGWEGAILAENVRLLYRPDDLQNPAYYEIPVIIPIPTSTPTEAPMNGEPAGFIILAANENDFPIAHWDFTGSPPTHILDWETDVPIQTYYKLDTLSYAAEDTQGNLAAALGQLPPKIEGMQMEWLDLEVEPGEVNWIPDEETADDHEAGVISGTLVISGAVTPPAELTITEWESWHELKAGYTQSYGVFLEQQRREASELWQGEQADLEQGIVLEKGDVYFVALLEPEPVRAVTLGLPYIITETVSQGSQLPELFKITVADVTPVGFTPFTVTLSYDNGLQEAIRFQIVAERHVYLPIVMLNPNSNINATAWAGSGGEQRDATSAANWRPWRVFWAGTHADQRLYTQISAGQGPNNSNCASGCGATAWGMLFGWVDNQAASGNPYWAPRWGTYRQDGGYGADAVAPPFMDNGVRNMIWEIRGRIRTFCAFGRGATTPWDMGRAAGYLANRSGARISTHFNVFGIPTKRLRERTHDSIIDHRTPAIIGTGWFNHYPLAYGYRWRSRRHCFIVCWNTYQRQFYVNQGWGGSGNGWISANTWFAGQIKP